MKRVLKVERLVDGGLLVELSDGSIARYLSARALPKAWTQSLLRRMNSPQVPPFSDGQANVDQCAAADSRTAYLSRLKDAHQHGAAANRYLKLSGQQLYEALLCAAWQHPPKMKPDDQAWKYWTGA